MRLVLGSEISTIDGLAQSEYGIFGLQLMENAGRAVAASAMEIFTSHNLAKNKDIAILVGKGNNGGDALVAARHLVNAGYNVKLFLLADPREFKGDALHNWQIAEKLELPYFVIEDENQIRIVKISLLSCSMIIDGIFGTGFRGEPNAIVSKLIKTVNGCDKFILAIDLPSGVDGTYGLVAGKAIRANTTVTLGWAKFGTRILPAADYVGDLQVVDISLPPALLSKVDSQIYETDFPLIRKLLPKRAINSHKGNYGHLAIMGGSENMYGAPILAAGGALKTGIGLVTVAAPKGVVVPLAANYPEAMSRPFKTHGGGIVLKDDALVDFEHFIEDKVLVLGMGMGRLAETQKMICKLTKCPKQGLVVDADALFAVAKAKLTFASLAVPVVLTPHPGEMATLLGVSVDEVEGDRLGAVVAAAKVFGAVVVLKGANTIIANGQNLEPGTEPRIFLNQTGNPGMATGGSGDVLAGVIGSLLAQGLAGEAAAAVGVYLHGLAGDLAKAVYGEFGMSATNLVEFLPKALVEILGKEE